ncbi:MAG TPA: hypothetical protein VGM91_18130 [Conexibacter sp.]|jgi:tetratricopeptide (TPR) repeat protein
MSTATPFVANGRLDTTEVAGAFEHALRDRAGGNAVRACTTWAQVEEAARDAGARHLAVQAAAERSLTLTWMGALSGAGILCEKLLVELDQLEHGEQADEQLTPPPLDEERMHRWAGAWFSVAGLHRLRAEQLRRSGDYAGALEELDEASRAPDQRPNAALPQWGRVILSEALRLAGDFDGAYEVAAAALARADEEEAHPWVVAIADRALARALLALDELDEAVARFRAMAREPIHRNADSAVACDLGIGEALRRSGARATAGHHLGRARALAREHGHTVGWIHAQLCLAELARDRREDPGEVAELVAQVHRELLLSEHPWLRLRAFAIGALSANGARAERLIGRAEDELLRFHRRSCDLELERDLVERCRFAVTAGVPAEPIELDFL